MAKFDKVTIRVFKTAIITDGIGLIAGRPNQTSRLLSSHCDGVDFGSAFKGKP